MTTETHEGHLEGSPVLPSAPAQMSWREKRYQRRRRRVWFEEILGWILVPVIVIACYWLLDMTLNAVGTSPAAIADGVKAIIDSF
jgi:hypothetical protein